MAGSLLATILIPIGAFLSLTFWIFMIFYADSHPARGGGPASLDSGEYDTGLQGPYLTKPELRLPRQQRRRLGEAASAPGEGVGADERPTAAAATSDAAARVPQQQAGTSDRMPRRG